MKRSKILPILFLAVIPFSACTKKTTAIVPYPSVSPANGSTVDNTQNYDPYQQGVGANPNYYGNGATLSDDTSAFNNTTTTPQTDPNTTTGTNTNVSSNTNVNVNVPTGTDDLGLGNLPNLEPYSPPGGAAAGQSYALAGNIAVDQDSYIPSSIPYVGALAPSRNQWQAVGVAATGSSVILSAFDSSGLLKKGTVISINSSTGKDWKNIGSEWLGTKHPLNATVKGIAIDSSGKMFAVDADKYIYRLDKANTIAKIDAGVSGGMDIVAVSDGVIVATSTGLKKYDYSTLTGGTDFSTGISPTGGMGTDKSGNVYVVTSSSVKKITPAGVASDFITGISNGVDVAVNDTGKVFLLTKEGIIMYDETGKQVSAFGQGDFQVGTAIAAAGSDLYVSDTGSSYRDSQVVKYSIMSL